MKKIILFSLLLNSGSALAQWNNSGDNSTTGSLSIGSTANNSYSSLTINGPNVPENPDSKRDINFSFAGAGKAYIRSYRGGSWDTHLQFLTSDPDNYGGTPSVKVHIDGFGNTGIGTTTPGARLEVNGDIALRSQTGNKQIYTWHPSDGNWRIGMSADPGFTRSLATSHVEYLTYSTSPGQGFAVGVNGGQSSFEILGSSHNAFFRGHVGIGTPSPEAKLDISNIAAEEPAIKLASLIMVPNMLNWSWNSIAREGDAGLIIKNGKSLVIAPHQNAVSGMRITANGDVGIGTPLTTNPNNYRLAVNGKIGAKEVMVEITSGTWPDYVFEPEYKLPSLLELEQYIKVNKHLPEVPSAVEVKENGLSVGEMNTILLKKMEELTLHMIELKKENDKMKEENEQQEKTIKSLLERFK
jgi:hypothetical protein